MFGLALALLAMPLAASAQEDEDKSLTGRYAGFAMSEGVVVSLAEDNGRVLGQFTDAQGRVYALNGQRVGDGAQGAMVRGEMSEFFQLEMRPLGIQFMRIPPKADGTPDLGAARQAALAREGVEVEELLGAAPRERPSFDPKLAFIGDTPGPKLAETYLGLAPRERELIRLFDHVQAHLTGRLCSAVEDGAIDGDSRAVSLALERQQAGCSAIDTLRDRAAASPQYADFLTRLAVQQELLATTLACDSGGNDAETCQTAGAMNATMFEQWRRAAVIYADIAGQGGTAAGTGVPGSAPSLRGGVTEQPVPTANPVR